MRKNFIMLIAVCAVALAVTACGEKDEAKETATATPEVTETVAPEAEATPSAEPAEETKKPTQKPTAKPTQKATKAPVAATPAPTQKPVQTQAPAPVKVSADTAAAYIGRSTSALVSAIGQPSSKTYATSCIGDGDDGEWYYPGFTVYTYRDPNGSERVEDVLAN